MKRSLRITRKVSDLYKVIDIMDWHEQKMFSVAKNI